MPTLVVLFNLKSSVSVADYEDWARNTDLPIVNGLNSVQQFQVLRSASVLGSDQPAPYQYVETLVVPDLPALFGDISSPVMQKVAAQFQEFADQPIFIVCNDIQDG
jgi:hypothetical protein